MKLIECHIAGFGAFKNYKLSFDDGLNVILQPNGWGKTTLAAYIKAMLYGFERKRVRDVNENERLRYKPWGGGKYGGTLDFECRGHEYRVVREFGATPSSDSLKVVDIATGKRVNLSGEEVGDWVFGLDVNAFQKSVFVGQNGFGFDGSTSSLRNRLNALVNEADDVAGLDKAQAALDSRRKHYKKMGNRGYIADVSAKMGKLLERQKGYDSQIAQMGLLQEQMSQLDSEIHRLSATAAAMQEKIDIAQAGEKDVAALTAAHDQLIERLTRAKKAYADYKNQVGNIPSEQDLATVRKAVEAIGACERDLAEAEAAKVAVEQKTSQVAAKYAGSIPTKADVELRKRQLVELAHQMEAIGLAKPSDEGEYGDLDAAVAADPSLLGRVDAALAGWSAVENDRNCAARLDALQSQIAAAEEDLGSLSGVPSVNEADLKNIDDGVAACKAAASKLSDAKAAVAVEESKAAMLKAAADKAANELQQVKSSLADVEIEKAHAEADAAAAKAEEAAATSRAKGGSNVAAIALIACGVIAFVIGAISSVGLPIYVLGALLLGIGVFLFCKAIAGGAKPPAQDEAKATAATPALTAAERKLSEFSDLRDRATEAFDKAQADLGAHAERLAAANESVSVAAKADADAKNSLVQLLLNYMPTEDLDPETVAVQAPVLKNRLAAVGRKQRRVDELKAQIADLEAGVKRAGDYAAGLAPLLKAFGVEPNVDTAIEVERLGAAVSAYRGYKQESIKADAEACQSRKAADDLAADLDSWARALGFPGKDGLTDAAFDAMAADIASIEKTEWSAQEAAEKGNKATESLNKLRPVVSRFFEMQGIADAADFVASLELVSSRAKQASLLAGEIKAAQDQLSTWEGKNAEQLNASKVSTDDVKTAQLKTALDQLRADKESKTAEMAQLKEKRNAILNELEGYLGCAQEIRLLAQRKQLATANLFTVQKTSEYLSKARTNLDERYLGGLTDRFNDYVSTWLSDDDLEVAVAGDFDVEVREGASAHAVASYSTGYQDLFDVCLRMALVDTVFESEDPFIVMDDPFVNLDQEKIGRAMLLLALLSKMKQIIYFTCHPSRMEGDASEAQVEFTLPEQRASRELPKARAKRAAAERAQAQAALVASYHVSPVTQGRAAIRVADGKRAITNNMFNVGFDVDLKGGRRDNAFDVHFIDERGRALCERQIVEVVDGKVVPERLRFCLTTREDSGSAFDLIVHQQDKEESELAARVPYKADISFNTEDFGF